MILYCTTYWQQNLCLRFLQPVSNCSQSWVVCGRIIGVSGWLSSLLCRLYQVTCRIYIAVLQYSAVYTCTCILKGYKVQSQIGSSVTLYSFKPKYKHFSWNCTDSDIIHVDYILQMIRLPVYILLLVRMNTAITLIGL